MCETCYYAYPEKYQHIAGKMEKKLNLVFDSEDMTLYEEIIKQAELHKISYQNAVKRMIEYYQKTSSKKSE